MTQYSALFGPLARFLRRTRQAKAVTVNEPSFEDTVPLSQILMIFAKRPDGDSFPLMTQEMSPECVLFNTSEKLKPGETLEVRFLLNHGFTLTVRGSVNWIMQSAQGQSGQLDLKPTGEDRIHLRQCLKELRRVH